MLLCLCTPNLFNTIIRGIFQISNVAGNLSAYLIFAHVSSTWLFIIFTSTAAAGTAFLLLLQPFKNIGDEENHNTPNGVEESSTTAIIINEEARTGQGSVVIPNDINTYCEEQDKASEATQHKTSLAELLKGVARLFFDPRILLLDTMFFWSGFELAFWTGEFTELLDVNVRSFHSILLHPRTLIAHINNTDNRIGTLFCGDCRSSRRGGNWLDIRQAWQIFDCDTWSRHMGRRIDPLWPAKGADTPYRGKPTNPSSITPYLCCWVSAGSGRLHFQHTELCPPW